MKNFLFFILSIAALLAWGNNASAATSYLWTGSSGGVWASSANWLNLTTYTYSGYPGSSGTGDVAYFYGGTTVSYSSNLTINSIQTSYTCPNVTISLTGTTPILNMSTFSVGQQSSAAPGLTFTGTGTVNVSSSPTVNYLAGFNVGSGTTLTINGAVSFNNPPSMSNAGTLNVQNFTFTPGSTSYTLTNTGTINIASGYTFSTNTRLTNSGTINATGSTFNLTTYIGATITNSGAINATTGGNFTTNAPTTSSGTITISSSTLTLGQSGVITSSGNISITSPTTASAINLTSNSTGIVNSGTVTASGATFTMNGVASYITNSGTFTSNGCTFNTSNSSASNGINNSGTFNALSGTQVNLGGQSNNITNSGNFTLNASTVSMASGNNYVNITNQGSGIFTALNSSTISMAGYQDYIKNSSTFIAGTSGSPCVINISGQGNSIGSTACSIYNTSIFTLGSTSIINATGTDPYNPNVVYNNGGTFTLMSDATGSATVGVLGAGASFQGIFNVQRLVTGGAAADRNYRLFSCPVNKTQYISGIYNVVDLSYLGQSVTVPSTFNGAYIAGPGTGFGSTPLHTTPNPIIYLYQESILPGSKYNSSFTSGKNVGVYSIGSNSVTTISTALAGTTLSDNSSGVKIPPGNGYILYFIGSNQRTSVSSTILPDNAIVTATGYINQGNVPLYMWGVSPTLSLTNTTGTGSRAVGVTEVGNPYPSTIDLHTVYTDNSSNIGASFYELDGINQQFDSYNAITGTSGTTPYRYVASGQGFYTVVSATGNTLTFKEDQKTNSTTSPVFPSPSLMDVSKGSVADAVIAKKHTDALPTSITPTAVNPAGLHLKLFQDSSSYDEIGVYYSSAWSDKYDNNDSYDLDGLNPQVYLSSFTSDNVRVSINALNTYTTLGKRVRLYVRAVASGSYTLSMEDFLNIDTSLYNIYLVDNQQNDSLNLVQTKTYAFNINAADTAAFSNRFVLAVELKTLPAYQLVNFSGQKVPAGVQLNWKANNTGNYTGFVLQKQGEGNTYNSLYTIQSDSATNYSYVDEHPVLGSNVYRLQQSDITGKITYSAPVTIGYNSTSPNGALTVYPNPAKTTINVGLSSGSTSGVTYIADIYNASGATVGHQSVNSNNFTQDVSSYKLGVYVVQMKDNGGNLLGVAKFVKVE